MAFDRGITDSRWGSNGVYLSASMPDTASLSDMYSTLKVNNSADSDYYINPAARFEAFLLRNKSGEIIGLKFSHIN